MKGLVRLALAILAMAPIGLVAEMKATFEWIGEVGHWAMSGNGDRIFLTLFDDENIPTAYIWENGQTTEWIQLWVRAVSDDGNTVVGWDGNSGKIVQNGVATTISDTSGHWSDVGSPMLVSGNGEVALGGGTTTAGNRHWVWENGILNEVNSRVEYVLCISYDGGVLAGGVKGTYLPCRVENGEIQNIPAPAGGGGWAGSSAQSMSSDGLVIAGLYSGQAWIWKNNSTQYLDSTGIEDVNSIILNGDGNIAVGAVLTGFDPLVSEIAIWTEANNWQPILLSSLFSTIPMGYDQLQGPSIDFSTGGYVIVGQNMGELFRVELINTFGPYKIFNGFANTDEWLGILEVTHDPWIWCEMVPCWFNIPEQTADSGKGWMHVPTSEESALWIVQVPGTDWGYSHALEKWLYLTEHGWVYVM